MNIVLAVLKAFAVGGLICVFGQLLIDYTRLTPGKILVGFVVLGVILGAFGIYEPLLNWAECGASVPLTGFGAALAKGTREAIDEKGLLGVINGPLSSAATGVTIALLCGGIAAIFSRPKDK